MPSRPRNLIIPVAALIIVSLVAWRTLNPRQTLRGEQAPTAARPAPSFQLYDQDSKLVNLSGYLHRHKIVLVFFDGEVGADGNATLQALNDAYPELVRAEVVAFGITTAIPQQVRAKATQDYQFPLLSDAAALDQRSVHRAWNCLIEPETLSQPGRTKPAVFLIDRLGRIPWEGAFPKPLDENEVESLVARLLQ